jgi:hypothetical protein
MWAMNTTATKNGARTREQAHAALSSMLHPELRQELQNMEEEISRITDLAPQGTVPKAEAEALLVLNDRLALLRRELSQRYWKAVSEGDRADSELGPASWIEDLGWKTQAELARESLDFNQRDQRLWKALQGEVEQTGTVPTNLLATLTESLSFVDRIAARQRELVRRWIVGRVSCCPSRPSDSGRHAPHQ